MIRHLLLTALLALPLAPRLLAAAAAEPAMVPTQITCNYAESVRTDKEMNTVFTGDVVVTATNMSLRCDRLEVVSFVGGAKDEIIAKENQFKSLIAIGHVRIVQGAREATCGRAEVLPGDDKIILSERPLVVDAETGWTYSGKNLYLLRGERRVHGEKVTFTGPAVKDLGFDKKKLPGGAKTPEPAAPAPSGTPAPATPAAAPATDSSPSIQVPGAEPRK